MEQMDTEEGIEGHEVEAAAEVVEPFMVKGMEVARS